MWKMWTFCSLWQGRKSGFKPSKHNKQQQKQHSTQHHDRRQNLRGSGRQTNFVQDDMVHMSEDDSFVFTIEEQTCTLSAASNPVITVKIGGISKDVLIDSGSASNLISQDNFKELKQKGLKADLQSCSKKPGASSRGAV